MKMLKFAVMLGILNGLLSACNTVEGVGKDIRSAGNTLENAAARHK